MNRKKQCIDLRPDHLEIVRKILDRHLPGRKVLVFGSRATWTAKEYSDIDLAIIGDDSVPFDELSILVEEFKESDLPFKVDVVDCARVDDGFLEVILKEGVELANTGITKKSDNDIGIRLSNSINKSSTQNLGDCIEVNESTYSSKSNRAFVNYLDTGSITENRISKFQHLVIGQDKLPTRARKLARYGDIVYSLVRPNKKHFGLLKKVPANLVVSTGFFVFQGKPHVADSSFIYWYLTQDRIVEYLHSVAENSTTAYPSIKPNDIQNLRLVLPTLKLQSAIGKIFDTLDNKIELNRRMNETLEATAQAIFKDWFVDFGPTRAKASGRETKLPTEILDLFPQSLDNLGSKEIPEGWHVETLNEIAKFKNGLALQKFRPKRGEERLPVVKITQLRSGKADGNEWASDNIKPACIIDDGDIVFSWSASLLVDVWCGGRAALNQHLFKVTSELFPKWFVLYNIVQHLSDFRAIASGKATTMGHIKQEHLREANCVIPSDRVMKMANSILEPIFIKSVVALTESRILEALRDALLPKLISGEIEIRDAERIVESVV